MSSRETLKERQGMGQGQAFDGAAEIGGDLNGGGFRGLRKTL
jgi:hypothetical protein